MDDYRQKSGGHFCFCGGSKASDTQKTRALQMLASKDNGAHLAILQYSEHLIPSGLDPAQNAFLELLFIISARQFGSGYLSAGETSLDRDNACTHGLWRGIRNASLLAIPIWLLLIWSLAFVLR